MHIVFVPVIHKKDKKSGNQIEKIACSEYWKGKDSYRKLQDAYYEWITNAGFDLDRGRTRDIEHMSTERLKQITGYQIQKEEIKLTLEQENQRLKNENKTLKEYIEHTFEFFKNLLDISINSLRANVDNFIASKKKRKKTKEYEKNYEGLEEDFVDEHENYERHGP